MNKDFIKTIDLSKVSYIKLSAHAKSRIKQRFNVSKNNMNDWMLDLVKNGKVFDVSIADHQLRLKIISKDIIIVLDVINNTIVTVYPITIVNDSDSSDIDRNDTDMMNYLKGPLKQYRIFKNLDLVTDLNIQLTNMLTSTLEFQNDPSLDNSNQQFDNILHKMLSIIFTYKSRTSQLDRFFK
ncbi:hypothetical protein PO250_01355 [Limosilactobacillus mucosae]|uniref:Uncharacterized protein n=1 Tax=Limosilactobacillus mucosae TaxID=97478 RepID=A0AAJ1HQQ4_LIMMU|nr:hypothetical protein [Limosilactobacillus mucosae]MDC2828983.1 hypothetical protein [Limosilactobacillus mucosae]